MEIIGASPIEVWKKVGKLIFENGEQFGLLVTIKRPFEYSEEELRLFNPRRITKGVKSVFDVANTIFPDWLRFSRRKPATFCSYFEKVYKRGSKRRPYAWGTYFQRLISFGETGENQLLRVLEGAGTWGRGHKAAFVFHLSAPNLDKPRPLGGPCWQYGQIIQESNGCLSLVAVYRSHDYYSKALGNFVGLARLLGYICNKTGKHSGYIRCLSTYAFLSGTKRKQQRLIDASR